MGTYFTIPRLVVAIVATNLGVIRCHGDCYSTLQPTIVIPNLSPCLLHPIIVVVKSFKSVPLQKAFTPLTCSRFGIVRGNLLRFSGWLSFQSAPLMTAGRSQFLLTFENNNKADVRVPRREGAAGRCFCCSQPSIYARRSCFCLSGVNVCLLNPMNPLSLSL